MLFPEGSHLLRGIIKVYKIRGNLALSPHIMSALTSFLLLLQSHNSLLSLKHTSTLMGRIRTPAVSLALNTLPPDTHMVCSNVRLSAESYLKLPLQTAVLVSPYSSLPSALFLSPTAASPDKTYVLIVYISAIIFRNMNFYILYPTIMHIT